MEFQGLIDCESECITDRLGFIKQKYHQNKDKLFPEMTFKHSKADEDIINPEIKSNNDVNLNITGNIAKTVTPTFKPQSKIKNKYVSPSYNAMNTLNSYSSHFISNDSPSLSSTLLNNNNNINNNNGHKPRGRSDSNISLHSQSSESLSPILHSTMINPLLSPYKAQTNLMPDLNTSLKLNQSSDNDIKQDINNNNNNNNTNGHQYSHVSGPLKFMRSASLNPQYHNSPAFSTSPWLYNVGLVGNSRLLRAQSSVSMYNLNNTNRKKKSIKGFYNDNWRTIWFDRLLIDYLLRNKLYNTTKYMLKDNCIEPLTHYRTYHKNMYAIESLKNRDYNGIITWCQRNKSELKKYQNNLEFIARSRVVIELLRENKLIDANKYIKEHLLDNVYNNNENNNDNNNDNDISEDNKDNNSMDLDDEKTERIKRDKKYKKISQYRWRLIQKLYTACTFTNVVFNNEKYKKLQELLAQYNASKTIILNSPILKQNMDINGNTIEEELNKIKNEYCQILKEKLPPKVYQLFFEPSYFWDIIEMEFWKMFKLINGFNKHSMLEYILTTSLQTIKTPYCYHKYWKNNNCETCIGSRNLCSKIANDKDYDYNIYEITHKKSYIVCQQTEHKLNNNNNINPKIKNDKFNNYAIYWQKSKKVELPYLLPNGVVVDEKVSIIIYYYICMYYIILYFLMNIFR